MTLSLGTPKRLEAVLHVLGAEPDVLDVPAQLVVDVGMPVGEEDGEVEAGVHEVLDLLGADHPADVDQAGRLEADIAAGPVLGRQQLASGPPPVTISSVFRAIRLNLCSRSMSIGVESVRRYLWLFYSGHSVGWEGRVLAIIFIPYPPVLTPST